MSRSEPISFPLFCLMHKTIAEEHAALRRYLALVRYEAVLTSPSFDLPRTRTRVKK